MRGFPGTNSLETLLQEWYAPTAASSCSAAFRNLTRNTRLMNPDVIQHLSTRNVKAVAEFVIKLQKTLSFRGGLSESWIDGFGAVRYSRSNPDGSFEHLVIALKLLGLSLIHI